MVDLYFDRFYRYDALTHILHDFAETYPHLVRVESLGKSYEERDIWLVTVTNFSTGVDTDKPAFWVDGNIHATELSASAACLYLLQTLTSRYGEVPEITNLLDTRAFYICPRVNPDGAEWALADKPRYIRSSTRPYPYAEEPLGGLVEEDVDGDGRILTMRIPDPNGAWKVSEVEPRLMVRRDPVETGGIYYRMIPEGPIEDYDGVTIAPKPRKERLDLNRNFPSGWRQEYQQRGAGSFPTSEPETRATVHFVTRHLNITGGIAFHTFSGVLLRPYDDRDDKEMPIEDLWTFQKIGAKGTEITSYPNVSVFHDFRYHPKEVITGGFDTWLYDHMGVFGWTIEIWSPQRQAGIKDYKFIDWYREHSFEDDLTMLKWSDTVLEGKGYIDWYSFDHPQLGPVELGGWNRLYAFRNPPPQFLEKELAPLVDWVLWHAQISPKLELYEVTVTRLGGNAYHIRMVVHNTGWLPSYVTKNAVEKKIVRGVICEIELPEGAVLETGKRREELGQLEGRAYKTVSSIGGSDDFTEDRLKVEWVVRAPNGGTIKLSARHERAGKVTTEVSL
ncbi:MAG: carboxypeptidase [Anaerolineae bacterium]|nr:carboxypeptidase [Anaerolineae bacterium]